MITRDFASGEVWGLQLAVANILAAAGTVTAGTSSFPTLADTEMSEEAVISAVFNFDDPALTLLRAVARITGFSISNVANNQIFHYPLDIGPAMSISGTLRATAATKFRILVPPGSLVSVQWEVQNSDVVDHNITGQNNVMYGSNIRLVQSPRYAMNTLVNNPAWKMKRFEVIEGQP